MMPEQDGFSVCKEIRSEDGETPILFLSAKNEEIDVVVGLELGADDFIQKPFGKRELIARIRGALRRSKSSAAKKKSFEMGGWNIFPRELRAEREKIGCRVDSPRNRYPRAALTAGGRSCQSR